MIIHIFEWIGAIIGALGFTIGLIFWDNEKFEENETLYKSLICVGMLIYFICAFLVLRIYLPAEEGWRIASVGGIEWVILLGLILIAKGIRRLKIF